MSSDIQLAFLSIAAGALLGGAARAAVVRYSLFAEGKGIATALAAELSAILEIAQRRDYTRVTEALAARLVDTSRVVAAEDIIGVRLSQGYLSVYTSVCPKIGLLGPLSAEVVRVYSGLKRVFEDLTDMREMRDRLLMGGPPPPRELVLQRTLDIADQMKLLSVMSEELTARLKAQARRRWLGIVP